MKRFSWFYAAIILGVLAGCSGVSDRTLPAGSSSGSALYAPAPTPTPTNFILNGSFEKPVAPASSYLLFSKGHTFFSWTVSGAAGNVAVIGKNFSAHGFNLPAQCGKQWLDLTGTSETKTGVRQATVTVAQTKYTLTFEVGNVYQPSGSIGTSSTALVYVNGRKIYTATNNKGRGVNHIVWERFSTTFTAPSSKTVIQFLNGDPSSDNLNGLDCVTLTKA
ncbi:MAG: DUF642 domain-containing protein [Candidatus Tumulicola sp.]